MTLLSKNFEESEFKCPCKKCDGGVMSPIFMERLQKLRDLINVPLKIDSGYRCAEKNKEVGGEPSSMHLYGRAADIFAVDGQTAVLLLHAAFQVGFTGFGIERKSGGHGFIHVDDRDGVALLWTY